MDMLGLTPPARLAGWLGQRGAARLWGKPAAFQRHPALAAPGAPALPDARVKVPGSGSRHGTDGGSAPGLRGQDRGSRQQWGGSAGGAGCRYLGEEVEGFVQVGVHAGGRLVGDFDGVLQQALRDDVCLGAEGWLGTHEHPVVCVAAHAVPLHSLLQRAQPACHQVDVLQHRALLHGVL